MSAFAYYRDLFLKYKVLPPDTLNLNNDDTRRRFEEGKAAMTLTGPWAIPSIAETSPDMKYTISTLPGRVASKPGRYELGGFDIGLTVWSSKKEATKKFIDYYLLPENNAYITDAFPAIKKAGDADRYKDPRLQAFIKQIADGSLPMIVSSKDPAIKESTIVAIHRIFLGDDLEKVVSELNKEVQGILDSK